MQWHNPLFLIALVILPVLAIAYILQSRRPGPTIHFPSAARLKGLTPSSSRWLRHTPVVLRLAAIGLLIVALARPQQALDEQKVTSEGIDIVIALDISTSMLAEDLKPKNRLEAAKQVAREFIEERTSDRIGLVMFAGESYTWCPLTLDYHVLSQLMDEVEAGTVTDGTGIGKAIATGANRLRSSDAKSKVLILLTDGVNNVDQPDPLTAAGAAGELGIKIYTIGIGTRGMARAPVQTAGGIVYQTVQVEIDEELLRQIAQMTGGQYFRATTTEGLRDIYARIDRLERSEVDVEHIRHYRERFYPFAAFALLLLLVERLLVLTRLRNVAE
ncbi:VWA domain-containing protein [bacterium]|nr:VWA domain-containing protein [bacterium]